MSDNFLTLFGTPPSQQIDITAHLKGLFYFIEDKDTESIMYRTLFELGGQCFSPEKADFGPPCISNAGDRVWFRVRSFLEGAPLHDRAMEPMVAGEVREFVIVVGAARAPRSEGSMTMIRSHRLKSSESEKVAQYVGCPSILEPPSYGASGTSMIPLLYCDRHKRKPKREEIVIENFPMSVLGSVDVFAKDGNTRYIKRNFSSFEIAEWICEVENPTRYKGNSPFVQQISCTEFEFNRKQFVSKIQTNLQRQKEKHPTTNDDELPQTVTCAEAAFKLGEFYAELTTIGFFVDLIAANTFNGLPLALFEDPHNAPLFICLCVTLAANPIIESLGPSPDDDFCAKQVFNSFASLTSDMTTLEQLTRICVQNAEFVANDGARKSNVQGQVKPLQTVVEGMRRQGISLCNELVSMQNVDAEAYYLNEANDFLPEAVRRDASDALLPACISRSIKNARRAGVRGVCRADQTRATRCASKDAAMRSVVGMLYDFNDFLCTGVYRNRRLCGDANLDFNYHVPNGVNIQAWEDSKVAAQGYMNMGIFRLAQTASMLCFPVRPRTRMTCARCLDPFSPFDMSTHLRASNCGKCGGHYCETCHAKIIEIIKNHTKNATVSAEDANSTRDLWNCGRCTVGKTKKK